MRNDVISFVEIYFSKPFILDLSNGVNVYKKYLSFFDEYLDNDEFYEIFYQEILCKRTCSILALKNIFPFEFYKKLLNKLHDNQNLDGIFYNLYPNFDLDYGWNDGSLVDFIESEKGYLKKVLESAMKNGQYPSYFASRLGMLYCLSIFKMPKEADDCARKFIFDTDIQFLVHEVNAYFSYLLNITGVEDKIIECIKKGMAIKLVPLALKSKKIVKVALQEHQDCYADLDVELQVDSEIVDIYLNTDLENIVNINPNYSDYETLVKDIVLKKPYLFGNFSILATDIELYKKIVDENPNAFSFLDEKFLTKENFSLIKKPNFLNLECMAMDKFKICLDREIFNFDNYIFYVNFWNYLVEKGEENREYKFPKYLITILEKNLKVNFLGVISFVIKCNILNFDDFNDEFKDVYKKVMNIYRLSGKENLLKHVNFTYDLINVIYPVIGLKCTVNFLKYRTNAYEMLLSLLPLHRVLVIDIIKFVEEKLDIDDDKIIHYLFNSENYNFNLYKSILMNKDYLTDEDLLNFKKILLNNNIFNINNLAELKSYKEIAKSNVGKYIESESMFVYEIKKLFGFKNTGEFRIFVKSLNLDNPEMLGYI